MLHGGGERANLLLQASREKKREQEKKEKERKREREKERETERNREREREEYVSGGDQLIRCRGIGRASRYVRR